MAAEQIAFYWANRLNGMKQMLALTKATFFVKLLKIFILDIYWYCHSFTSILYAVVLCWSIFSEWRSTVWLCMYICTVNYDAWKAQTKSPTMPSILLNSTNITTEKLMPMVEVTTKAAAVAAIPITITKTTNTIITNLSAASSNGQKQRPIIIYPTGKHLSFPTFTMTFIPFQIIAGAFVTFLYLSINFESLLK